MKQKPYGVLEKRWPTLSEFPVPARALVTAVILIMALGMGGATGQIIVHDIIPTFYSEGVEPGHGETGGEGIEHGSSTRGDLFDLEEEKEKQSAPFYKTEQFVWLLKWSHIHLFGMNMIFVFVGGVTLFLNMGSRAKTWLILLPFAGVQIDILAMWLKTYVSPAFFWLHIPGGGLFGTVFFISSAAALYEMWLKKEKG